MSPSARVLLGALLGAVITLFLHPYSRPRLFAAALSWGPPPTGLTVDALVGQEVLPQPKSVADYSLWMDAGARRIVNRYPTGNREWTNLLEAAARAAKLEPDNAFWTQMQAIFRLAMKQRGRAHAEWKRAARKSRWDDGQTGYLVKLRAKLEQSFGDAAWTSTAVYPRRSEAPARTIELFARDIARQSPIDTPQGLDLRYATVVNGRLMRDGARSVRVAELGIAAIELASYPSDLTSINSPRKLLLARTELYNALRRAGLKTASDEVDRTYKDNDSWIAYGSSEEAERDFVWASWLILVANCGFAILLVGAGIGVALASLSAQFGRLPLAASMLTPPGLALTAIALSAATFAASGSWVTSLIVCAAMGFLAFGPIRTRTHPTLELGPLHGFLVVVVGGLMVASFGAIHLQMATPGQLLLDAIGFPFRALGGLGPPVSVLALTSSMLAIVAAFYALAYRIATPAVLWHSVEKLGRGMAWTALVSATICAPIFLWIDRVVGEDMNQRLTNEPVFYYLAQ